jgi:hypothetical protein
MLVHGLQGFHNKLLKLPVREAAKPDQGLLEQRYGRFLKQVS